MDRGFLVEMTDPYKSELFVCTVGKRKSRAKPPSNMRMDQLDTMFSCPFCNQRTSVEYIVVLVTLLIQISKIHLAM
ncbi:putative transcription elongation factor 1 [Helianthus anomalus]